MAGGAAQKLPQVRAQRQGTSSVSQIVPLLLPISFLHDCDDAHTPNAHTQPTKQNKTNQAVFFCKYPDLYVLNKALLYARHNETTVASLVVVHCYADPFEDAAIFRDFQRNVELSELVGSL